MVDVVAPVSEPGIAGATSRVRVMVVDDDPDSRMVLRDWLERRGGFQVVWEAADGVEAVEVVTQVRPQAVVLDLAMPRMGGLEAASLIRRLLPDVRVVLHSSFSTGRMAQRAIDAGADVYVEKAVGGAEVLSVLEGLFPTGRIPRPTLQPELQLPAPRESHDDGSGETTELLEAAVVSSPVGAVLLDQAGRLVIVNPVADRLLAGTFLLGVDPPKRSLLWADTRRPARSEDLPVQSACEGTPFDDVELVVVDDPSVPGGTYVTLSGRPVTSAAGDSAGAVISVQDDTAAQKAAWALAATAEELQRSNAELANFASTASHDLSQPLMKIQGYAELLQELDLGDPRARDFVDRIVHGTERMRDFIRDLLSFSRVTSAAHRLEAVDLATLVLEVVDLFEVEIADTGARLDVGTLPTVVADPTQISHLLQNLVGNALTYVAEGVTPEISIRSTRQDDGWLVSVADNGIGIAPEDRDRAFTMFERLETVEEYSGTGIGLAVCAKIVERHGGRIWIESAPGQGTSVCFTLPDRPEA